MYSFGGVCTRMFNIWLVETCGFTTNNQVDVHHGWDSMNKSNKVIYIYSDPVEAVLSFYGKHHAGGNDGVFLNKHAKNLNIQEAPPTSITKYNEDHFKLYDHYKRYTDRVSKIQDKPTLLLNTQYLWDYEDQLLKFLNINHKLPQLKSKRPKPWLTDSILNNLNEIYSEMREELNCTDKFVSNNQLTDTNNC
jgi:hypothetical protein